MDADGYPSIPEDLLLRLEADYPEHFAVPGDTLDALMFAGGKRDLVAKLRLVFDEQQAPKDETPPEPPEVTLDT